MSKFNKLTLLAESAPTGPWVAENDSLYFDDDGYTRHLLDADAGHDVTEKGYCAALKFIAAANPKVVLELIAEAAKSEQDYKDVVGTIELRDIEIERLKAEVERLRTAEGDAMTYKAGMENCAAQRDQLKRDNESLRKDGERYQWLRDKSEALHSFYLSVPIWMTGVKFKKESVDISIDAAIKQGERQ